LSAGYSCRVVLFTNQLALLWLGSGALSTQ
jgi:hypothetical protein